jgi:small subunit ribosomal protein S5
MASSPDRPRRDHAEFFEDKGGFEDTLVKLYRCATVVKGGRRFSFGALVVVGDRQGQVGFGYGKANEVPPAVEKGVKQARRRLVNVPRRGATIPHRVMGKFGSSRVLLIPAAPGTGVIASSAPRAVLELAGVKDVLTKCYGSTSPKNLIKATFDGLLALRTRAQVEALRGVSLDLPPEPEYVPEPVRIRSERPERGRGGRGGRGGRPGGRGGPGDRRGGRGPREDFAPAPAPAPAAPAVAPAQTQDAAAPPPSEG